MERLEAVVFDVDGTLVDTEELHIQAFNHAFQRFGLDWNWTPDLYAELLNISGGLDRISRYAERLHLSDSEGERLRQSASAIHREKTRIYGELLAVTPISPRPGIRRLIDEALGSGVSVGLVASSALPSAHSVIVSALGLDIGKSIAAVASADHVERKKPAPDLYELVLRMLRRPASACVAFEDSANGVTAAKAAGIFTIATPSRWTTSQDFTLADLVIPDVGDPGRPLDPAAAAKVGAPFVSIAGLAALRSRSR